MSALSFCILAQSLKFSAVTHLFKVKLTEAPNLSKAHLHSKFSFPQMLKRYSGIETIYFKLSVHRRYIFIGKEIIISK